MLPVLLLALGVLVGPSARPVHACSCAPASDLGSYRSADVVFTGDAVEHRDPRTGERLVSTADPLFWRFEVESVDKGRVPEVVEVATARDGGACGYGFREGGRYQVFARSGEDRLQTGLCDGTRDLGTGQVAFHPGTPGQPVSGGEAAREPQPSPAGFAAGLVSLAFLGLAFGSVVFGIAYHHALRPRS